jgi:hypothetical protein
LLKKILNIEFLAFEDPEEQTAYKKKEKKWNAIHFVENIIYKKSKTSLLNFPPYSSGALQKNMKKKL